MAYRRYDKTSPSIEIIDLTVDSPINHAFNSRRRWIMEPVNGRITEVSLEQSVILEEPNNNSGQNVNCQSNSTVPVNTVHSCNVENENVIILTCPICFQNVSVERKPTATKCGHIYCEDCLNIALKRSKTCPTCKARITQKTCRRIFF